MDKDSMVTWAKKKVKGKRDIIRRKIRREGRRGDNSFDNVKCHRKDSRKETSHNRKSETAGGRRWFHVL